MFTQEEILKILPNLPIAPKSICVRSGYSVLIGGVARLDILRGPEGSRWSDWPLLLTIFISDELPINVVRYVDIRVGLRLTNGYQIKYIGYLCMNIEFKVSLTQIQHS